MITLKNIKQQNKTVKLIPLGVSENGEEIFMLMPIIKGRLISNTILIVGGTGSGKTVIKKNIITVISRIRPVYLFDWAGRDDYLSYYQNRTAEFISPNLNPSGLKGIYFYYDVEGARKKKDYEVVIKPDFTKYSLTELQHLGFSAGASMYLQNVIERYGPFKSFNEFVEFIEKFPTSEARSNAMVNNKDRYEVSHDVFYERGDTIPTISKDNLLKILPGLLRKNIYRMDNLQDVDFNKYIKSKYNLIFSYNDLTIGKTEISYAIRQIKKFRDENPQDEIKPFLSIEEAQRIYDGDEISKEIEDFVLVCRKLGIGLILTMSDITKLDNRVLSDIKDILVGKMKGTNANNLINIIGKTEAVRIKYLHYNRFTGERQFIYYNQDYDNLFLIDKAYMPVCEVNRQI